MDAEQADRAHKTAVALLGGAFTWGDSPEGHSYWQSVYDKLMAATAEPTSNGPTHYPDGTPFNDCWGPLGYHYVAGEYSQAGTLMEDDGWGLASIAFSRAEFGQSDLTRGLVPSDRGAILAYEVA